MEIAGTRRLFRFRAASHQPMGNLEPTLNTRITSIDLLRGLVMIVMALDHVRDYFHADAYLFDPSDVSQTNVPLFFTRFITHYCAPVFMMLSGTSAYLVGQRKGRAAMSRFLLTRGLWLVFIELTVVNFGWFFNPSYPVLATIVIWALGVSMIFLAALVYLPVNAILAISLLMIFGHNLFDGIQVSAGISQYLWAVVHVRQPFFFSHVTWMAAYPLVPWVGVMSLGYCIGQWFAPGFDAARRRKLLLVYGSAATVLFVVLRYSNLYGDPILWSHQSTATKTFLSFLDLQKYPPSLLYLLVTLGPSLIFLSFTEQQNGWLSRQVRVIGRVPMFYYLIHIYLIHAAAMITAQLTGFGWRSFVLHTWVTMEPALKGYGLSLRGTYLVWGGLIVMMYFLCRWYDRYKQTHKYWWLSYL